MTETKRRFYITRTGVDTPASRIALAMQSPYSRLEDAWYDMGGGIIFDSTGAVVAFHERHLLWIEHYGLRMVNFPA